MGKKGRSPSQQADMVAVFGSNSDLDYVACWFELAGRLMRVNPTVRTAFVATNSITQGEQVPMLWPGILTEECHISFAHRTFNWQSEARGAAHVNCVIIGLAIGTPGACVLYDYADVNGDPAHRTVERINAYLAEADDLYVRGRRESLMSVPTARFGSMPNDGGNFLLNEVEANNLRAFDPTAAEYLRPMLSARQMLRSIPRYCLWLQNALPQDLRTSAELRSRVMAVRRYREASTRPATQRLAATPTLFGEIRQPTSTYIPFLATRRNTGG